MKELKIKYNAILKQQAIAMEWFESEDFRERFKEEGQPFIERVELKYKRYEEARVKILKALQDNGEAPTVEEIIRGFKI